MLWMLLVGVIIMSLLGTLCFKLQKSQIAMVLSTIALAIAAMLWQLVMLIVDKMVLEDQIAELEEILASNHTEVQLPDRTITLFGCSTKDAFSVFEDLYLLANSKKPHFTVVRKCGYAD